VGHRICVEHSHRALSLMTDLLRIRLQWPPIPRCGNLPDSGPRCCSWSLHFISPQ
jgi:hypothetical protein